MRHGNRPVGQHLNMTDLIRLEDAATRLGVHVGTVREWVRTRRVPSYRVGAQFVRVSWSELLAAMSAWGNPQNEDPGYVAYDGTSDNSAEDPDVRPQSARVIPQAPQGPDPAGPGQTAPVRPQPTQPSAIERTEAGEKE